MKAPAIYECVVRHTRTAPVRNSFRYGTYLWLVDLDDLPRLPRPLRPLAGFDTRARRDLDAYLSEHGLAADRVAMLAAARVFGHVFNPLTVYWCYLGDALVCTVAEVHNTYGGRHRYLLPPGAHEVAKELYVSPFNPMEGLYRLDLPAPGERLALTVTLHTPGRPPFAASVRGRGVHASPAALIRAFARHPFAPLVVAARIRCQGVALYLRGLKVVPRGGKR